MHESEHINDERNQNKISSGGYRRRRYDYQGSRSGQAFDRHADERSNGTGKVAYRHSSAETETKADAGGEMANAVDDDKSSCSTEMMCAFFFLNLLFNYVHAAQFIRNKFCCLLFFHLLEFPFCTSSYIVLLHWLKSDYF